MNGLHVCNVLLMILAIDVASEAILVFKKLPIKVPTGFCQISSFDLCRNLDIVRRQLQGVNSPDVMNLLSI